MALTPPATQADFDLDPVGRAARHHLLRRRKRMTRNRTRLPAGRNLGRMGRTPSAFSNTPVTSPRPKPLPQLTPETAPFWEAARHHRLRMQWCRDCRAFYFYPRPFCRTCGGPNVEWRDLAGTGTLYSFVINHLPAPGFEGDVPYVIALVDLDEGPRLMTNLVNVAPDPAVIRVGMPVRVVFHDANPEVTLPLFEPAAACGEGAGA